MCVYLLRDITDDAQNVGLAVAQQDGSMHIHGESGAILAHMRGSRVEGSTTTYDVHELPKVIMGVRMHEDGATLTDQLLLLVAVYGAERGVGLDYHTIHRMDDQTVARGVKHGAILCFQFSNICVG